LIIEPRSGGAQNAAQVRVQYPERDARATRSPRSTKPLQTRSIGIPLAEDGRRCGRSSSLRGLPAPGGSERLFPARDERGMKRSRRSFAPSPATKRSPLQGFYGSDGTRTRDLRRDRPVMVLPDWAGVGGDLRRSRSITAWPCGDCRKSAGASGDLLQDIRGMGSLPQLQTADAYGMRIRPLPAAQLSNSPPIRRRTDDQAASVALQRQRVVRERVSYGARARTRSR
jgi:hypothetical protein